MKAIAFYLPQFYPTRENDKWWEPGFTEWTNVVRAKPLFRGHYQPRIPQELSFYDLRVPETRERQVELAREAGIDGFCYWHYWFGNGKRLLDQVFREVVECGKPDFPFCLCWANHSWYQKTWNPNVPNKLLIEQTYPGVDDYKAHFMEMLPAFKDRRYIRNAEGKLVFGIFEPKNFIDFEIFKKTWNSLAKDNGLNGFDFFALAQGKEKLDIIKKYNYDKFVYETIQDAFKKNEVKRFTINWLLLRIRRILNKPEMIMDYSDYVNFAIKRFCEIPDVTPCIDPMFDHSPRSNGKGYILHNNDPKLWGKLCRKVKEIVESHKNDKDKFVFIKAWNEWGEGNYMEPDSHFGRAYIEEAGKVFR
ncbi:glycoside hydrolase family 99-like domain-containing protein [Fibrobacter sp.]|uniref:glycosyltransferase WbsX family protein n=1 Tax=Fibrobacter sp. TaxID=35828 RepID=UPI00386ADB6C